MLMQHFSKCVVPGRCSWHRQSPWLAAPAVFTQSTMGHPRLMRQLTVSVQHMRLQCVHTGFSRFLFSNISVCKGGVGYRGGGVAEAASDRLAVGRHQGIDVLLHVFVGKLLQMTAFNHNRQTASGKPAKAPLCAGQCCVGGCGHSRLPWIRSDRTWTQRGNLFTRSSHTEARCRLVYSKVVSMNGRVGWKKNAFTCVFEYLCGALWMQMNAHSE